MVQKFFSFTSILNIKSFDLLLKRKNIRKYIVLDALIIKDEAGIRLIETLVYRTFELSSN